MFKSRFGICLGRGLKLRRRFLRNSAAIACGSLLILLGILFPQGTANAKVIGTVYPLGDSITYGETSSRGAGYRDKLYSDFVSAGDNATFVGTTTINSSTNLASANQDRHEGHRGYAIAQISNNLDGNDNTVVFDDTNHGGFWLSNAAHTTTGQIPQTNVILLLAGTNDILQGAAASTVSARLDALLGKLVTLRPNSSLILSTLPPINNSFNQVVKDYNLTIPLKVRALSQSGYQVSYVDQYANFVDGNGNVNGALLPDNVHPSQSAYDAMADTWFAGITAVPEPATTSTLLPAVLLLLKRRTRKRRATSPE